jgi:hypothetical protein
MIGCDEGISLKCIFLKSSSRGKAHFYSGLSRVNPNIFLGVKNLNPIRTTLNSNEGGPKETTDNIKQLPKKRILHNEPQEKTFPN